jgi:hypothetical protein
MWTIANGGESGVGRETARSRDCETARKRMAGPVVRQKPIADNPSPHENADSRSRSHRRLVLRLQVLPADRSVGTQRSLRCRLLGLSPIGPRSAGFHTVRRNTVSGIAAWTKVVALLPPTGNRVHSRGVAARFRAVLGATGRPFPSVRCCLGAELLRLPIRLRGPRCFSTYTLHDCARLSIGSSGQFCDSCEIGAMATNGGAPREWARPVSGHLGRNFDERGVERSGLAHAPSSGRESGQGQRHGLCVERMT